MRLIAKNPVRLMGRPFILAMKFRLNLSSIPKRRRNWSDCDRRRRGRSERTGRTGAHRSG